MQERRAAHMAHSHYTTHPSSQGNPPPGMMQGPPPQLSHGPPPPPGGSAHGPPPPMINPPSVVHGHGPPPPAILGPTVVMDMMEQIKSSYVAMEQEYNVCKMHRDELERKLDAQISEFQLMHSAIVELENAFTHAKQQ